MKKMENSELTQQIFIVLRQIEDRVNKLLAWAKKPGLDYETLSGMKARDVERRFGGRRA